MISRKMVKSAMLTAEIEADKCRVWTGEIYRIIKVARNEGIMTTDEENVADVFLSEARGLTKDAISIARNGRKRRERSMRGIEIAMLAFTSNRLRSVRLNVKRVMSLLEMECQPESAVNDLLTGLTKRQQERKAS